jgi:TPR repeat protein
LFFLTSFAVAGSNSVCIPSKEDFTKDIKTHTQLCSVGNYENCERLGYILNLQCKAKEAEHYLKLACSNGVGIACLNLAALEFRKENPELALKLFRQAGRLGAVQAYDKLSTYYHLTKQYEKAIYYGEKGCSLGDLGSCASLATYYFNKRKYRKSKKYARQSCYGSGRSVSEEVSKNKSSFRGSVKGCLLLGRIYYVKKRKHKAKEVFNHLCSEKIASGCHLSGVVHRSMGMKAESEKDFSTGCQLGSSESCRLIAVVKEDKTAAMELCKKGDGTSCIAVGLMAIKGGKRKTGFRYIKKECYAKTKSACLIIGKMYFSDTKMKKSKSIRKAKKYFRKAYETDDETVVDYFMGLTLSLQGKKRKGERLIRKSCRAGHSDACDLLRKAKLASR